jgi:hypothetical protein
MQLELRWRAMVRGWEEKNEDLQDSRMMGLKVVGTVVVPNEDV